MCWLCWVVWDGVKVSLKVNWLIIVGLLCWLMRSCCLLCCWSSVGRGWFCVLVWICFVLLIIVVMFELIVIVFGIIC